MMRRPLLAATVLAAALALAPPSAAHAAEGAAEAETLTLDTHGTQPVAVAATPLAAGAPYAVTVRGTYSIVPARRWGIPAVCGTPLPAPLLPSPGVENGKVGADAELLFAQTARLGCSGAYPRAHQRFQIDVGSGFRHVRAEGGPFAQPRDDYRYLVTGTGAPPRFRVQDAPAEDNYGLLRIVVVRVDTGSPDPPRDSGPGGLDPSARRCLARRVLRLRLGSAAEVVRARVTVDGRRWGRVRRGRQVTARVDLRRLTRDRVRVRVRVLTRDGRRLTRVRAYATCSRWS